MADQVSNLLQLVKQETGNNNNNWGVILNQQLDKLEAAIAGQSVLIVTGGTKALTDDEQRPQILLLTGNLTSDAFVEVKAHLKSWIVLNACTGPYSVGIRTANNPAYYVPRNASAHIWCDGATIWPVGENGKVPVGSVVWSFRTVGIPGGIEFEPGYVEANGQAIGRVHYARLYEKTGTLHGGGDGSTTFNVPNIVGRYVRGRGGNAGTTIGALQDDMVKSHAHLATVATDGAHAHTGSTSTNGNHNHSYFRVTESDQSSGLATGNTNALGVSSSTGSAGSHNHTFTTNTDGAHTHGITVHADGGVENRPLSIVAVPLIRVQ